jgi:hypothetical protein
MIFISTFILCGALAGCTSDSVPTSSLAEVDVLSKISDAPAQSGPNVFRIDDIFGWTIVDWAKDLTDYAGFDIHEYCDWVLAGYQGDIPIEAALFTFRNPGGGDRLMLQGRGENMTTSVWPTAHDWRDECSTGYYDSVSPVALGYSTAKAQDNGGAFPDTPNTNSFGVKFNGTFRLQQATRSI